MPVHPPYRERFRVLAKGLEDEPEYRPYLSEPIASLIVSPCALFTVMAKPAATGNCVRSIRVPSFKAVQGKIGTHFGSFG